MLRKLFKKNRYFIVCYIATKKGFRHTGTIEFMSTSGHYLRESSIKDIINRRNGSILKDIVITNIIEMSKSDFKEWNPESSLFDTCGKTHEVTRDKGAPKDL